MSAGEPGGAVAAKAAEGARYPLIDALRGVAILLVVLRHVELRIPLGSGAPPGEASWAVWSLFCTNGNEGVRLFFVISGFLITTTSLNRWGSLARIDAAWFYALRFARIVPSLVALLAVLSLLHFWGASRYVIDTERVSYARALLAALSFHVNWLEASRNVYLPASWDVLWSLGIEEVFYLLLPIAGLAFRRRFAGYGLLLGLVVAGAAARWVLVGQGMWQSKSYLACMDGIALGCLTAALTHGKLLSRPAVAALAIGSGLLVLAVLTLGNLPAFLFLSEPGLHLTILAVACAGLLVAGARLQLGGLSVVLLRPLSAYGRLSYEVYLTHCFVVLSAADAFYAFGKPAGVTYPLVAAVLVGSWALGAGVERHFSSPANRWLRAAFSSRAGGAPGAMACGVSAGR
jgi:peptidoglycan/LPS O-acetylase OafA/YrhL